MIPDGAMTHRLTNRLGATLRLATSLIVMLAVALSIGAVSASADEVVPVYTDAIRPATATGEVFFDQTYQVSRSANGPVVLANRPDGSGSIFVDDVMSVAVTHPDGSVREQTYDFSHGCGPLQREGPVDIAPLFANAGVHDIRIRMYDQCGIEVGATDIFLVLSETPPENNVALGDSFSAGEGVEPFDPQTDRYNADGSPANLCHRSDGLAYSQRLSEAAVVKHFGTALPRRFVACSGAVTKNVLYSGQWDERSQIQSVTGHTRMVTLTIGGNDANFPYVLEQCVSGPFASGSPGCRTRLNPDVTRRIQALQGKPPLPDITRLSEIYKRIWEKSEKRAELFVLTYPQIFGKPKPRRGNPDGGCALGPANQYRVAGSDIEWMRDKTGDVNVVIHNEARVARNAGVPITVVRVDGQFDQHGLCDKQSPWFNELIVRQDPRGKWGPWQGSFHPNNQGHDSMANSIESRLG